MAVIMLSAASQPTPSTSSGQALAKSARMGHPVFRYGNRQQVCGSLGHPPAVSGTLTINTYLSGASTISSAVDGHAWLTFTTETGNTTTYGTYGNENGAQEVQGVNESSLGELTVTPTASRSENLTPEAAERLSFYISNMIKQGSDAWSATWPCSGFASVGWYLATHEYLDSTKGGLLNNPTNLQNAINEANRGH